MPRRSGAKAKKVASKSGKKQTGSGTHVFSWTGDALVSTLDELRESKQPATCFMSYSQLLRTEGTKPPFSAYLLCSLPTKSKVVEAAVTSANLAHAFTYNEFSSVCMIDVAKGQTLCSYTPRPIAAAATAAPSPVAASPPAAALAAALT